MEICKKLVINKGGESPVKEIIEIDGEVEISRDGDYLIIEKVNQVKHQNSNYIHNIGM